ncbi:MAG: 50S ribosomal protein L23 [Flavobacteriaceae bacterium]|jgi:large subunit ribosomal protein L23|nr:50S ribosomal protein L23 [Flavobacteriaceae bacterium]MBR66064.1 50S ribosomal protein L23 [Flavobacteriaceae bacterium]|tara:strand:+ start:618 stop:908 length:291 start_codon:yes stop_codon:yes gene_type:complete
MKVIFEPIITEKATNDSELRNRYTFVVNREANKIQIKDAVENKYNVTVEKVRTQIYGSERKTKFTKRGVQRTKTNIKKKAIVDIQDGDSIDFYNNL